MSTVTCVDLGDGCHRYGDGPGYLIFDSKGNVKISRGGGIYPERDSLTKNLKTTDGLRDLQALVFDPTAKERVAERILDIMREPSTVTAERKLDELRSDLTAARRLSYADPKATNKHDSFRAILQHEAKRLQRVPTKSDMREALCVNAAEVSHLCTANGFAWLPTEPPGVGYRLRL